jgi:hypothetical protein
MTGARVLLLSQMPAAGARMRWATRIATRRRMQALVVPRLLRQTWEQAGQALAGEPQPTRIRVDEQCQVGRHNGIMEDLVRSVRPKS